MDHVLTEHARDALKKRPTIDRLVINSPYEEPARHWCYERETRTFDRVEEAEREIEARFPSAGIRERLLSRRSVTS